ncbi:MAG TPA: hypothetical protein VFP87_09140 [Chitinophagaceae bacterium]|nr:hypothetical protein [Chitinophagaceae bacterium]
MKSSFIQKEILHYLEETDQESYHFFIDLEPPHIDTAGSRLTLYSDENRSVLVFEISGYVHSGYRSEIELTYFGNCLVNLQTEGNPQGYTSNMKSVLLIDSAEIERIEDDMNELLSKKAKKNKGAGGHAGHRSREISLSSQGHDDNPENLIDIPSLIRYLDEEYPTLFRATYTTAGTKPWPLAAIFKKIGNQEIDPASGK